MQNQNQNQMELVIVRTADFFSSVDLSLAELAKVDEPEWESIPAKGTRHPSTRGERRKKTAHAKTRHSATLRTRELRKYPYSHMLGKGKRHDHIWIYEDSIVETRQEEKRKSELRDFVSRDLRYEDFLDNYVEDEEDDWIYVHHLEDEVSKRDEYIRFLENRIRDLEREIGF